ncbi:MAG: hypothetical protein KGD74_05595, partial [Candidatus Lokiarchaeota archaeon]|nr:hypothetical protein [Candidatus Lokiarchaeota archaeon]
LVFRVENLLYIVECKCTAMQLSQTTKFVSWGKKFDETGFSDKITCMAYNIYDLQDFLIWSECFRKIYGILIKLCFILEPSIIKQDGIELAFDIFKKQSIDLEENDALNVLIEFIELKKNQYENS